MISEQDSGLFLRSTEDGKAWQAMIDYHSGGNLMGIYGEGLGAKPSVSNYQFLETPDRITVITIHLSNSRSFPNPGNFSGDTANGTSSARASKAILHTS